MLSIRSEVAKELVNIRRLGIQPGKPTQNEYIEKFNRTARHECLDMNLFHNIEDMLKTITKWL